MTLIEIRVHRIRGMLKLEELRDQYKGLEPASEREGGGEGC